jgi:hypothetical protein
MSNTLTIKVGKFILNNQESIIILADDAYASTFLLFDSFDNFINQYPTEKKLVLDILENDAFEDGAYVTGENYELFNIDKIDIVGYTDLLQNERN